VRNTEIKTPFSVSSPFLFLFATGHFTKTGSGQTQTKNGLFEPFIYKNDDFAKTGSGQP